MSFLNKLLNASGDNNDNSVEEKDFDQIEFGFKKGKFMREYDRVRHYRNKTLTSD